MTVKVQKVFEILGIQPKEAFNISGRNGKFRFNERLEFERYYTDCDCWLSFKEISYRDFLFDRLKIVKITGTTRRDQIAIDYAKAFGCKYIAADKDGTYWAYNTKPVKKGDAWGSTDNGEMWQLYIPVSFISWEDAEPYYLGGEKVE